VRRLTRNGIDWSGRFPLIAEAAGDLKVRSCLTPPEQEKGGVSRANVRIR
jgi:hypothetical protein